jgi:diaminohydroxyphosphoribosylaminopyrimidine deaminase/5-amino-6-(5-phosphoribosylamino)uracil reductase
MQDPFAKVNGAGIARLREHGVVVDVGLLEPEVRRLNAPFRKLVEAGVPWVHAKWAMSLDGKIATRTGHSQWISGAASRALVHRLRGRMDAIIVGIGTALVDDPQLTARPAGPRVATRVVLDSTARLPVASKLVATAREIPLLVATGESAPAERVAALRAAGAEVLAFAAEPGETGPSPAAVLRELGGRRSTNVLIEGGSRLLGAFYDRQLIDEAHVFLGTKLLGGEGAKSPLGGMGRAEVPALPSLENVAIEIIEGDIYVRGFARRD